MTRVTALFHILWRGSGFHAEPLEQRRGKTLEFYPAAMSCRHAHYEWDDGQADLWKISKLDSRKRYDRHPKC